MFAVDSIPAVFGVTEDPFIVLTSNLFAVIGLRYILCVCVCVCVSEAIASPYLPSREPAFSMEIY
jgi:hypothetical protein